MGNSMNNARTNRPAEESTSECSSSKTNICNSVLTHKRTLCLPDLFFSLDLPGTGYSGSEIELTKDWWPKWGSRLFFFAIWNVCLYETIQYDFWNNRINSLFTKSQYLTKWKAILSLNITKIIYLTNTSYAHVHIDIWLRILVWIETS